MGTDAPKSNIEIDFSEIDSRGGWTQLYQKIRSESSKNDFTIQAANKSKNKSLNRYRDVSPYDHSRIVLSKGKCDYINANLMKMEEANRQYILTQGPLKVTTGHFWLMVWEQNCPAVVMLNRTVEKNQEKCHQYWPEGKVNGGEDTMVLSDVGLAVEFVSEKQASYYTTRILRVKEIESEESREIKHFHYTTWPDFGVPQSPTLFLRFLGAVVRSDCLNASGPTVVHCSAGIGRSGTFCLVDTCLVLMKKNGVKTVDLKKLLLEMRQYRMGLIQTPDQLRFSYQAIIQAINTNWDPHQEEDSDKSCEDEACSEEEEEPPPPPPRNESLFSKPLPSEPNDMGEKVRARRAAEARARVETKVGEMKRKQKENNREAWSRLKRSLLQPLPLGLTAAIITTSVALISFYYASRD